MQLKQRLNTDRSLQPLLARFVPHVVHINDKKEKSAFVKQFQLKRISVPMLLISDTDGKTVDVINGAPQGKKLPQFILAGLEKAGAAQAAKPNRKPPRTQPGGDAPDTDDQENAAAVAREVGAFLREKKYAAAVAALVPHADSDDRTVKRLVTSLNSRAGRMLSKATRQLAQDKTQQIKGALEIVRVYRVFGELPALSDRFDSALAKIRKVDGLLAQAEVIDRGRAAEESGDTEAAIEAYKKVVGDFPDTAAAKLCTVRLEQLRAS